MLFLRLPLSLCALLVGALADGTFQDELQQPLQPSEAVVPHHIAIIGQSLSLARTIQLYPSTIFTPPRPILIFI